MAYQARYHPFIAGKEKYAARSPEAASVYQFMFLKTGSRHKQE
jgi:hypothetical protein